MKNKILKVFTGVLCAGLITVSAASYFKNHYFIKITTDFSNSIAAVFPEKQINFEIVDGVVPPEALQKLPFTDSGLSWFLNKNKIEEFLQQDPTLLSAQIKTCGIMPFLCFTVLLEQRVPIGFMMDQQKAIYLVGSDGGFIRKARKEDALLSLPTFIVTKNDTSDIIRKKIQLLSGIATKTKDKLSVMPSTISLKSSDIELQWKKLPLRAILSSDTLYDEKRLEEELSRLTLLLKMYKGREAVIEAIDLTAHRVAVVSEVAEKPIVKG